MKITLLTVSLLPAIAALRAPRHYYEERFYDWMNKHGHDFSDGNEFVKRLQIWAEADDYIEEHNQGNHTFVLGHNQYSHLSPEEFTYMMGFKGEEYKKRGRVGQPQGLGAMDLESLADAIDWVELGAVTNVKDQGQCGSCYSFSATGALEGAYFNKYGKLESFSEEEIVSCDHEDHGCNGGFMDTVYDWVQKNGGLCTEEDYPYTAEVDRCKERSCESVQGSAVTGWIDVDPTEMGLMSALNKGPVSVAIEADQKSFQLYASGVFTSTCGTNLDHGVLAVGYGTDEATKLDFYIIKNSWGPSWGENGYIKLQKGVRQVGGQCGILMAASYPTLK